MFPLAPYPFGVTRAYLDAGLPFELQITYKKRAEQRGTVIRL